VARGNETVLKRVLSIDNHFYITVVTKFEILIGIPKLKEMDFLDSFEKLPFDDRSAEVAAEVYRKVKDAGRMISLRDLFIGSICLAYKLPLVTLDRDFETLKKLGLNLILIE
jgi:predicted nucleic acid-binding protein